MLQEEKVTYYPWDSYLLLGPNSGIDNHMINGTKLFNLTGIARGRRDGILRAEKMKHVVKSGPKHLRGVW